MLSVTGGSNPSAIPEIIPNSNYRRTTTVNLSAANRYYCEVYGTHTCSGRNAYSPTTAPDPTIHMELEVDICEQ